SSQAGKAVRLLLPACFLPRLGGGLLVALGEREDRPQEFLVVGPIPLASVGGTNSRKTIRPFGPNHATIFLGTYSGDKAPTRRTAIVPLPRPAASVRPSGLNARLVMKLLPRKTCTRSPLAASSRWTVPSCPPDASRPSGLQATARTAPWCQRHGS